MQANCPKCANQIVIDDARVPDRAFSVKCPKCQTSVRFPGKGAAAAPAAPAPATAPARPPARAAAPPSPEPSRPAADPAVEALRAEAMAQVRRELTLGDAPRTMTGRALVSLSDPAQAAAFAPTLGRQGFQVDNVENPDEGARLIDQGVYDLVVTTRADAGAGRESLYQRMARLSPDSRRRVFLVLVGEDLKTGDGTQAWIAMADLVVNPRDLGALDNVLSKTMEERARLYQVYLDARRRFEASAV